MSLSPRLIALQGLGAAPRFVALQGLVPTTGAPDRGKRRHPRLPDLARLRRQRDEEEFFLLRR